MAQGQPVQKLVRVDNIRNDVVVAKGGLMRVVLQVSSINLALKSAEEQEAIIFEYQNFLNSLDFPIQILVNSRYVNIDEYLQTIREKIPTQKTELLRMQTQEYVKFIEKFTKEANIVSTDFFIVIPFSLIEAATQRGGGKERAKSIFGASSKLTVMDPERFQYFKSQLMQRVDFVASGLSRIGVHARVLTTKELVSMFWSLYNPGDLRRKNLIKPIFF